MHEKEERIAKFAAAINADAGECRKKIEAELMSATASAVQKERLELEDHAKREIKQEASRLHDASNRLLSEKFAENRAALTRKRSEITREVFKAAEKKLADFTNSSDYDNFLKNSAEKFAEVFSDGTLTVFVREEDLNKKELFEKYTGRACRMTVDAAIKIGGFKVKNEDGTLFADDTLDSRLSAQREWFLENCGMSVIL